MAAAAAPGPGAEAPAATQATTIGIIVTNAAIDKVGCLRLAQSGHDGLARALDPVHTGGDGDALVAAATGEVDAPLETVRALAAWVVEQAVLDAVPRPVPEKGIRGLKHRPKKAASQGPGTFSVAPAPTTGHESPSVKVERAGFATAKEARRAGFDSFPSPRRRVEEAWSPG